MTDTTTPLFRAGILWTIQNCNFVYPNQVENGTGPIVYPPLLASFAAASGLGRCTFRNNRVVNCYDFLAADGVGTNVANYCGDVIIDSCRIYSINIDFRLSVVTEIISVSNCLFSVESAPFNYTSIATYTAVSGACVNSIGDGTATVDPTVQSAVNFSNTYIFGKRYVCHALSTIYNGRWVGCGFDQCQQILRTEVGCSLAGLTITGGIAYGLQYNNGNAQTPVLFDLNGNYGVNLIVSDLNVNFTNGPLLSVVNPSTMTAGGYLKFHVNCLNFNHASPTDPNATAITLSAPKVIAQLDCAIGTSSTNPQNTTGINVQAISVLMLRGFFTALYTPIAINTTTGLIKLEGVTTVSTGATYSITASSFSNVYAGVTSVSVGAHAVGANYFDKPNPSLTQ